MDKTFFIKQIQEVLSGFEQLKAQSQYTDLSDIDDEKVAELMTKAKAVVSRIAGNHSEYYKDILDVLKKNHLAEGTKLANTCGILKALKGDFENDYMESLYSLIHSDVFSDYLEMSSYLLEEGYKDPAAVITGSTLESHLRELCKKGNIDIEVLNSKGKAIPKKAELMNSDLAKAKTYTLTYQKQITAWLDLRNNAAHGHFGKYLADEVKLMIAGVKQFILLNPA
jgi:hypothetical protein